MGTSKGYISPTKPQWSQAKRAVTGFLSSGSSDSLAKAGSMFASAMKADASSGGVVSGTFTSAATGILGLARNIASHGGSGALERINRSDLIGRPSEEIFSELFSSFTNNSSTIEDALAAEVLSKTLTNLNIIEFEQLGDISQEVLLKEMLSNYIAANFDLRFAEKIGKDRTPSEAARIIKEMQNYIKHNLYENLKLDDIKDVDFTNPANKAYVEKVLTNSYTVFEKLYGGE